MRHLITDPRRESGINRRIFALPARAPEAQRFASYMQSSKGIAHLVIKTGKVIESGAERVRIVRRFGYLLCAQKIFESAVEFKPVERAGSRVAPRKASGHALLSGAGGDAGVSVEGFARFEIPALRSELNRLRLHAEQFRRWPD